MFHIDLVPPTLRTSAESQVKREAKNPHNGLSFSSTDKLLNIRKVTKLLLHTGIIVHARFPF
jgi:hypothetical protein